MVLLIALLFGSNCSGPRETLKGTIKGTVYVLGNEPFTSLAIEDSTKKVYRISSSKDMRQRLLGLQGKTVWIYYTKIDSTQEGVTISVHDFKEVSP